MKSLIYFANVTNLDELKQTFRKFVKQYHPDVNLEVDTTKIMQQINAEYEYLITKGIPKSKTDSRTTTSQDMEDGFREVIAKIINLDDVVTIEICGTWIWISGNTYANKSKIKEAGFTWCGKKKMWSWKPDEWKRKSFKSMTMDEIRSKYGSQVVKEQKKVMA
ncbi:hypothetical protein [Paenibacillus elgii]|uniref:hypothetical protein n=1 Tax=Paenibacillus elgii TaxID=189691 RepID=UPI002042308C|nr:hypothetical protein [Paenibacillus elgii]MCM3271134.1 hypothetical protein [Paenibacillus elgii]